MGVAPKLADGVDGFYAAYARGEVTSPPDELVELVLVPAVLNTPWAVWLDYPPAVKMLSRRLLMEHIAAGHALNVNVIKAD